LNFKEILELIDRVAQRGISLELEQAGVKLKIDSRRQEPWPPQYAEPGRAQAHAQSPSYAPAPASAPLPAVTENAIDESWHVITSPIVGTFYRAPNPESEIFVSEGDRINKGSVLCIIEAMKLMNEIESDVAGVVVKIFPQNGQPVEYGEKLFAVKTEPA